mgnify:FL=1
MTLYVCYLAQMEIKLKGKSVVTGCAKGIAFLYKKNISNIPCYDISESQITAEWLRFQVALKETKRQLLQLKDSTLKTFGNSKAEIFDIQLALLDDTHILNQLRQKLIETKKNIEFCFNVVVDECLKRFKFHELSLIRDRYLDFDDVGSRLLRILLKNLSQNILNENLQGKILFTKSLTPSDVLSLRDKKLTGIILEEKCLISHAVILAKSLGIPIIAGVDDIVNTIPNNSHIEINGETGEIWIDTITSHLPKETSNISETFNNPLNIKFYLSYDPSTCKEHLQNKFISGIGLLRSEVLFLSIKKILTEEEQFAYYKEAIEKAEGKTVILRTLDIGGDKNIDEKATSPLGLRGIRWSLKNRSLFKAQLRAMLRASAFGSAKILFPMISSEQELIQANKILEACKQELKERGMIFDKDIKTGAMLETPCAFLTLDLLAKHCTFFSIGTNDLLQYILAIDRTDNQVAELYNWQNQAILRALQTIAKKTTDLNTPVYICGELPNIPEAFLFCIGIGFRNFTISFDRLTRYQKIIDKIDIIKLQKATKYVLSNPNKMNVFEKFLKI